MTDPKLDPSIPGIEVRQLVTHADDRGSLTEIFRECWVPRPKFVQWNAVHTRAGGLRGVHVHTRHADYLVLLSGRLSLGLADLRPDQGGRSALIELQASNPIAVVIPPGVAHGFLFPVDSVFVYAVSEYFDPADELGCRWDDPALGIPWPGTPTSVSPRDEKLPSLETLRRQMAASRELAAPAAP